MKYYTLYIIYQHKCKGFSKVFSLKNIYNFHVDGNTVLINGGEDLVEVKFDKIITIQMHEQLHKE